jgi:hypothetical protein
MEIFVDLFGDFPDEEMANRAAHRVKNMYV